METELLKSNILSYLQVLLTQPQPFCILGIVLSYSTVPRVLGYEWETTNIWRSTELTKWVKYIIVLCFYSKDFVRRLSGKPVLKISQQIHCLGSGIYVQAFISHRTSEWTKARQFLQQEHTARLKQTLWYLLCDKGKHTFPRCHFSRQLWYFRKHLVSSNYSACLYNIIDALHHPQTL